MESCFNNNRGLNPIAQEWANTLCDVSEYQIKYGLDNLINRDDNRFAPNAYEFRNLCIGNEFESVMDEILCRLQDGGKYRFKSKISFNVWFSLNYSPALNETAAAIIARAKSIFKMLDRSAMFDLPDYSKSDDVKKISDESTPGENERRIFQSHMFAVIYSANPELFAAPENLDIPYMNLNEEPNLADLPDLMKNIFSKAGTLELIQKFKEMGHKLPDKPKNLNSVLSGSESKKEPQIYYSGVREVFSKFLIDQEIIRL